MVDTYQELPLYRKSSPACHPREGGDPAQHASRSDSVVSIQSCFTAHDKGLIPAFAGMTNWGGCAIPFYHLGELFPAILT